MTDLSGTLEGVGLPAVVRFLSGLQKTGCLRIAHQEWHGEVYFEDGRVVSAAFGSRHGLSALDALVQALPGGTFTFESDVRLASGPNIDLSQEALQAHLDELAKRTADGAPSLPSLDAVAHVVPLAEGTTTEDAVPLDRGTLQTLLAVDGRRTVREIISQRGSFEALWQLANLIEVGLVRISVTSADTAVEPTPPVVQAPARTLEPTRPAQRAELEPTPIVVEPIAPAPIAAPAQPIAATVEDATTATHCPKLGFEDDPSSSFGRPTRLHRCFAAATPLPLSLDQQRELCLSTQFGTCQRLASASDVPPVPGAPTVEAAPRPAVPAAAAPAAPADTAAPMTDPRIVRLPFGNRAGAPQRPAPDLQPVGSSEPARLRPPAMYRGGSDDSSAMRPTPLRSRTVRPQSGAATAQATSAPATATVEPTPVALPIADVAGRSDVLEPDTFQTSTSPRPRRLAGPAVPVPTIAAAGLVVIVIALVAVLLVPNLDTGLNEPDLDSTLLPNSSAVVSGTPISQIPVPRATAPAEQAGAATEAKPTAAAPSPTAVPAVPTAAPEPTAAASVAAPRTLLDESFEDNARNWPNNAQGVAAVTAGTYRIVPRQAAQFVAIGAPIPDIVRDVIVTATFRKVGGPAGGGYGIIVRDQGPGPRDGVNQTGRYYVLEAGDKGEIGMWRRDGDRWIDVLPWQTSPAVRTGTGAVNELTVRAIGDQLSLIVNGQEVATRTDSALPVGGIGTFVGGDGNQVAVEHFSVVVP